MPCEREPIIDELVLLAYSEDNKGFVGIDNKGYPFNNLLRQARKNLGLGRKELAEVIGVSDAYIGFCERFRLYPGIEIQNRIGQVVGIEPDELFPGWLQEFIKPYAEKVKAQGTAILDEGQITRKQLIQVQAIISEYGEDTVDPHEQAEKSDIKDIFDEVLQPPRFSPRHIKVIEYRFGLFEAEPMTLEVISRELGVTRERVRQIEEYTLRGLRHRNISRRYKEYGEGYGQKRSVYPPYTYLGDPIKVEHEQDITVSVVHEEEYQNVLRLIVTIYEKIYKLYNKLFRI